MIGVFAGPAGAGKSQVLRERLQPGEVVVDYTMLWVALTAAERGPDGKYPERTDDDPRLGLVSAVKAYALRDAARRELNGYTTTSDSRPEEIERLRRGGADGPVETIDPGREVVAARLSDPVSGRLSEQCSRALVALVQVNAMTTEHVYCAIELHADEERQGPGHLRGILLTYGEPVADGRGHVCRPGSLAWESDGILLNLSHDRTQPLMRVQPTTDGDKVLLDAVLPDTARARDAATMVCNRTYRGLSAEVRVTEDHMVGGRREITGARLVGAALVDTPAIRSATVEVHAAGRRVGLNHTLQDCLRRLPTVGGPGARHR